MFEQLGLIGCGLMGGSFALAMKKAGLVQRVVGYSPSSTTTEQALQMGVIDSIAPSALLAAAGSDLVLLAVPVAATEATLKSIKHLITPNMLVMDVGSTKTDVVQAARRALGKELASFVPAHPITGKELAGVAYADADLYQGAKVVLTPLEGEEGQAVPLERAQQLWTALGCQVHRMSAQAHDTAFAAVSHLPHLLAFAMMHSLTSQAHGADYLHMAGPGLRDFSRIAGSDPKIWRDILLANRQEVIGQLHSYRHALLAFETALHSGDAERLQTLIEQASSARQQFFGAGAGAAPKAPRLRSPALAPDDVHH